jgi:hypothetical protein
MVAGRGQRATRDRRGDVLERVNDHDGVGAAGGDPAGLLDRLLDGLALSVGGRRRSSPSGGGGGAALPVRDLLGTHAGEHDAQLDAALLGERGGDAAQRLALARAGRADERDARALAERG